MARPRLAVKNRRAERFNLRFTLLEIEDVRTQAARAGLDPHEYARRRVLGHVVQPPPGRADATLLCELNRIGVNVNQLARAHNADREFRGDWEAIASELRRLIEKVGAAYGS